jgi:ABC-type antimicrobial peptide transport system permease subunit
MLFWTTVKIGLSSLLANKMRSFLTMLGIIIGVAAVISMLAMGAGAKKQIMDRIAAMGSNLLFVRPEQANVGGVRSQAKTNMKIEHGQALIAEVPEIVRMSPVISNGTQVKYGNQNTRTNVIGVAPPYFVLRNYPIERGRPFTEAEVDGFARVCTIGPKAVEDLFGQDDPLGETIRVKNVNLRIIGVQKAKGDQGWANPDDNIHVPYTVAMQQLFGQENVQEFYVQVVEGCDIEIVTGKIRKVMRREHHLQSDQPDDFSIRSQSEWTQSAVESGQTFTFLLGGIASISLLVGGIGIMNIMLVTVTERTKEIGVRKAIGAKERSILLQFLIEAVIVSGLGGLLGVALGVGGALALAAWTEFTTIVEVDSVLLALSVSAFVGVFFGFYPARRAASLDPVEALRYE